MSYPAGQVPGTYNRWPVASDQQPRRFAGPRADPTAFLLLVLAGAAGLAQYLIAGFPVGASNVIGGTSVTGKQLLAVLQTHGTATSDVTRIALLVTTVGGGALVLLGLTALLPINHRPIGGVALVMSLAGVATSIWLVTQSATVLGSPAAALVKGDQLGWYLTAGSAVVGVVGSLKALSG